MALIAQAATLEARVPFLHFFDGFRTSHEVQKIEQLTDDDMSAMIDDELVRAHRARALSPDHPVLRGTAQNPDVFFQARETLQPFLRRPSRPSCRRPWTSSPSSSAASTTSSTTSAPPTPSASSSSWAPAPRPPTRPSSTSSPRARRSAPQGPPLPALRRRRLRRRPAQDRQVHRGPRPHQGAGRRGRAALPGRPHGPRRAPRRGQPPLRLPQGPRRPLRPVVQGVHARHGQGGLRRPEQAPAQEPLHRRHQRRRHAPQPRRTTPSFATEGDDVVRACSTAWAPTAPWAPTRTPSRSSARRPRTTPRATSSTTRRRPAPSPSPTCASGRGRSARPT